MMLLLAQAEAAGSATAESILFWVFAVIAVGAAIAVVTLRNIVHSALLLVVNLLSIAVLYLGLQSSFLGITQVIVYAGAIMVLFLFVIMLLGIDRDDLLTEQSRPRTVGAVLVGVVLAAGLVFVVGADTLTMGSACGAQAVPGDGSALPCVGLDEALAAQEQGSVGLLADTLFRDYAFAFEAAALLLVVATLGALVLGRRKDPALDEEPDGAPVPDDDELEQLVVAQAHLDRSEVHGSGAEQGGGAPLPADGRPRDPGADGSRAGGASADDATDETREDG